MNKRNYDNIKNTKSIYTYVLKVWYGKESHRHFKSSKFYILHVNNVKTWKNEYEKQGTTSYKKRQAVPGWTYNSNLQSGKESEESVLVFREGKTS